jgi:tetratricopeptide (TPR) repeat protein
VGELADRFNRVAAARPAGPRRGAAWLAAACAFAVLASPVRAHAAGHAHASHAETNETDARAKKLYHEGDRAYAEGRYEEAAADFEKAYELSQRPLLLFNLANAYERAGHYQKAANALSQYLPHAKPGERDMVQQRLDNLTKRAEKRAKERQKAEQAERAEQTEEQAKQRAAAPPPAPEPAPPEPAPPKPEPAPASPPPTAAYVLLGAGGAAITAGVVFAVLALGARSDENSHCSNSGGQRLCTSAASDAISADQRWSLLTDISVGAGVVAAGIGAYLLIGHSREKKSASAGHFVAAVGARARPGGGELSLVGLF